MMSPVPPRFSRALPLFAATLLLSACVNVGLGGGGKPPASLLTLTPIAQKADGAQAAGQAASAMTVLTPDLPRKLATTRVPVQVDDVQIAYLVGATWVDNPGELFRRLLSETIAASSGRLVLDERQYVTAPETRLSGELVEFGVDARSRQVVIIYDATFAPAAKAPVRRQRFAARVPLNAVEPVPVGEALNRGANEVAAAVARWIAQ